MASLVRLALYLGALLPAALAAPTAPSKNSEEIPGKYIITLKSTASAAKVESHIQWVGDVHRRSLSKRETSGIEHTFNIKNWNAYAGQFDEDTIKEIEASPEVSFSPQIYRLLLTRKRSPLSSPIRLSSLTTSSPASCQTGPWLPSLELLGVLERSPTAPLALLATSMIPLLERALLPTSSTVVFWSPTLSSEDELLQDTASSRELTLTPLDTVLTLLVLLLALLMVSPRRSVHAVMCGVDFTKLFRQTLFPSRFSRAPREPTLVFSLASTGLSMILPPRVALARPLSTCLLVWYISPRDKVLPLTASSGGDASQAWISAIDAAYNSGVLSVVAAGNGDDNGNPLPVSSQSPANAANAITVAAITSAWKPTSFTNYGMLISFHSEPHEYLTNCWQALVSISLLLVRVFCLPGLVLTALPTPSVELLWPVPTLLVLLFTSRSSKVLLLLPLWQTVSRLLELLERSLVPCLAVLTWLPTTETVPKFERIYEGGAVVARLRD